MGLIERIFGAPAAASALAGAATQVAEVFRPNATRALELGDEAYIAALGAHGEELRNARPGWFDRFVNGLNRLPRPMLALGTLGLFVHAMVDPVGFAERMVGLAHVPEPLWWLLGAIVGFYFGAREAHHFRNRPSLPLSGISGPPRAGAAAPGAAEENAALDAWRSMRDD